MCDYQTATGKTSKAIVAALRPAYKGYSAQMQSKVRRPDYYGVTLTEEAWALLTAQNAPQAPKRKLAYQLSFRMDKRLYGALQKLKKAKGYKSTQAFMLAMANEYAKRAKAALQSGPSEDQIAPQI